MTHIGVLSPPLSGHINPMATLGRELKQRGHRVTYLQIPDAETKVRAEGLEFLPIGQADWPPGSLAEYVAQIGKLSGLAGLFFTVKTNKIMNAAICRDAPDVIKAAGIEALLVDQIQPAGGTVADLLGIPFITVCNAMAMNREAGVPPFCTAWRYHNTWWAHLRNRAGYHLLDRVVQPIQQVINDYRRQWKLPIIRHLHNDSFSRLAQISQQPDAFDFPRTELSECFHYTGLWRNASPQSTPFPFERLTGKPLIYASLGTLQNTKQEIFHSIAAACEQLDVQLVLSHGGGMDEEVVQELPGSPLVVTYAPQLQLLARAKLTITHGGLNTVLDSLSHGVPLVAIPIMFEQPAIAARVSWLGVGEVVPLSRLSVPNLRAAIQQVLNHDSYYSAAARLQQSIYRSGGVKQAADIVEQAIATKRPVVKTQQVAAR